MASVLFISNGHGEAAIAARIARDVRAIAPTARVDHLPLVGIGEEGAGFDAIVGPRQTMPSGGLVAMGNVGAFARDVGAGFAGLFAAQLGYVRSARYDVRVAVGDAYALALALVGASRPIFVGTAKSVYVAPYGPFERVLLRRAARVFVRDEATARVLRAAGVDAEAPGNVIADLGVGTAPPLLGRGIGILPGSRATAYEAATAALTVTRLLGTIAPGVRALVSIARTLSAARMAAAVAAAGWTLADAADGGFAFTATAPGAEAVGWSGELGPLLAASDLVIGQAGTANEAAAAVGVPVVVLGSPRDRGWYRRRQVRLLGDAVLPVGVAPAAAARAVAALLGDPARREHMARVGRERMGAPGGSRGIALAVAAALGR